MNITNDGRGKPTAIAGLYSAVPCDMKITMKKAPRKARDPEATAARLVDAAMREFNARGYDGTDTNRIAKAAGFAPQTFYRHFADKKSVFLAVYARWWQGEMEALEKAAQGRPPSGEAAARIALAFHTKWRGFRRALRHLAIVDPEIRAARTAARKAQLVRRRQMSGTLQGDAELIAALLTAERLCDAAAEGELADLGLSPRTARAIVTEALARLVGSPNSKDR